MKNIKKINTIVFLFVALLIIGSCNLSENSTRVGTKVSYEYKDQPLLKEAIATVIVPTAQFNSVPLSNFEVHDDQGSFPKGFARFENKIDLSNGFIFRLNYHDFEGKGKEAIYICQSAPNNSEFSIIFARPNGNYLPRLWVGQDGRGSATYFPVNDSLGVSFVPNIVNETYKELEGMSPVDEPALLGRDAPLDYEVLAGKVAIDINSSGVLGSKITLINPDTGFSSETTLLSKYLYVNGAAYGPWTFMEYPDDRNNSPARYSLKIVTKDGKEWNFAKSIPIHSKFLHLQISTKIAPGAVILGVSDEGYFFESTGNSFQVPDELKNDPDVQERLKQSVK